MSTAALAGPGLPFAPTMAVTAPVLAVTAAATGDSLASFRDSVGESDALLREAAHVTWGLAPPLDSREGRVIARRYRLIERLGKGGFGEVWSALDTLSRTTVALKRLRRGSGDGAARACREVAALRLLRLPGVVRLTDEGVEDEHPYLVMELVPGLPFPGLPAPCSWEALRRPLVRLFEVLARVHAAGFVHRDLKPENVLVGAAGEPVVLDFGIAHAGAAFAPITGEGVMIGTPAFEAPEQLTDGPIGPATDLYAAGVMAFLALSGRLPHDVTSIPALLASRLYRPAPPIRSFEPSVPEGVARVIDGLLAIAPENRPRSAAEVARLLREADARPSAEGGAAPGVDLGEGPPFTEEALRDLFAGPDRVLHLREDAARILWLRTNGIPYRVRREIDAWIAEGLAWRSGDKVATSRAALEQLSEGNRALALGDASEVEDIVRAHRVAAASMPVGAPGRLQRLLALGDAADVGEITAEALASAERLLEEGNAGRAAANVTEALFALRRTDKAPPEHLADALSMLARAAFADGGPAALDRAIYELCRPGTAAAIAVPLAQLVRAGLAVEAWTDRAAELAEAIPSFDDARLERLRHGVRIEAARRVSVAEEEAVVSAVGAWAEESGDPLSRASHAHWLGRLRYCQNRFEESARAHEESAGLTGFPPLRIPALLFAGVSWLETFDLDRALARAGEARALAAGARSSFFEMLSEWLLRIIAYRSGRTDGAPPDIELCDLAPSLGSARWEAAVEVSEAIVAYRSGDLPVARDLAARAVRAYADSGHPIGSVLSKCVLVRAGGVLSAEEVDALKAQARACPVPEIGLQCLALLAESGVRADVAADDLLAMARAVPAEHRGKRLDVFSIEEALSRLGVA